MMVDGKDELGDDTRRDLQYNTNQTNNESEENQDGWMRLSGGRGLHPFLPARTAAPRQLLHPVFAPLDGQVEARAVAPSQ